MSRRLPKAIIMILPVLALLVGIAILLVGVGFFRRGNF